MTPFEFEQLLTNNAHETPEGCTLLEDGDWVDEGKYDHRFTVMRHDASGNTFGIDWSRVGDPWSGYDYSLDAVNQVWPHEVLVTQWLKTPLTF